jgi:predicted nuclease of predicted toxin-antitoxin system
VKPRFLADADFSRRTRIDFLTAHEAGLAGKDDLEVLSIAARERRILVSHDIDTMPQHFWEFIRTERSSGVFLINQNDPIALAVDELVLIWLASDASEWENQLRYLPL